MEGSWWLLRSGHLFLEIAVSRKAPHRPTPPYCALYAQAHSLGGKRGHIPSPVALSPSDQGEDNELLSLIHSSSGCGHLGARPLLHSLGAPQLSGPALPLRRSHGREHMGSQTCRTGSHGTCWCQHPCGCIQAGLQWAARSRGLGGDPRSSPPLQSPPHGHWLWRPLCLLLPQPYPSVTSVRPHSMTTLHLIFLAFLVAFDIADHFLLLVVASSCLR